MANRELFIIILNVLFDFYILGGNYYGKAKV